MDEKRFPVLDHPMTHPMAACSLPGGLSQEEVALVRDIHRLRERVADTRRRLADTADGSGKARLELELDALREERARLVARRETAWRDKMIRLGHLDPDEA